MNRPPRRVAWWAAVAGTVVGAAVLAWAVLGQGPDAPLARLLRQDMTWQAIQARQTWRVGMDPSFPPFEALDANGAPIGYDVDLARSLGDQMGVRTEIVAIGFDSLVDAVKAAKVDAVISAYPYDPRLTRDVAYSEPYFDAGLRLAVPAGSGVQRVEDLAGKRVAVEWGSEGDMIGRELQRQGNALTLVPQETPQAAIDAVLLQASADAVLIDNVTLVQAQQRGAALEGVGEMLTGNPYVIVLPRPAYELRTQINGALRRLQQQGTLGTLEAQWFVHDFPQPGQP